MRRWTVSHLRSSLAHSHLLLTGDDLGPHDGQAPLEREDILDDRLLLPVHGDAVRDLDDGVLLRLGEVALAALALDVEGEDAERRDLGPLADGGAGDYLLVAATRNRVLAGFSDTNSLYTHHECVLYALVLALWTHFESAIERLARAFKVARSLLILAVRRRCQINHQYTIHAYVRYATSYHSLT